MMQISIFISLPIKKEIIEIMGQHCYVDKKKSIDETLDQSFNLITNKGSQLRSNIYKSISAREMK